MKSELVKMINTLQRILTTDLVHLDTHVAQVWDLVLPSIDEKIEIGKAKNHSRRKPSLLF
jgi:hypothetical protein